MAASILLQDHPRFTVHLLSIALARHDAANLPVLAKSVLRSVFHHVVDTPYTPENGAAMNDLVACRWMCEEAEHAD